MSSDQKPIPQSYRLTNASVTAANSILPIIIKLMMFRDAVLSGFRWHKSVEESPELEASVDRIFAIICGAGWSAEAIRYLKKLKREGQWSNELTSKLPELNPVDPRQVWADLVDAEIEPPVLVKLRTIRDQCFAHFDPIVSQKIIGDITSGAIAPTFIEWTTKSNTTSRMTIAWNALVNHIFEVTDQNRPVSPEEVGTCILRVGILLENVIAIMIKVSALSWEKVNPAET